MAPENSRSTAVGYRLCQDFEIKIAMFCKSFFIFYCATDRISFHSDGQKSLSGFCKYFPFSVVKQPSGFFKDWQVNAQLCDLNGEKERHQGVGSLTKTDQFYQCPHQTVTETLEYNNGWNVQLISGSHTVGCTYWWLVQHENRNFTLVAVAQYKT